VRGHIIRQPGNRLQARTSRPSGVRRNSILSRCAVSGHVTQVARMAPSRCSSCTNEARAQGRANAAASGAVAQALRGIVGKRRRCRRASRGGLGAQPGLLTPGTEARGRRRVRGMSGSGRAAREAKKHRGTMITERAAERGPRRVLRSANNAGAYLERNPSSCVSSFTCPGIPDSGRGAADASCGSRGRRAATAVARVAGRSSRIAGAFPGMNDTVRVPERQGVLVCRGGDARNGHCAERDISLNRLALVIRK